MSVSFEASRILAKLRNLERRKSAGRKASGSEDARGRSPCTKFKGERNWHHGEAAAQRGLFEVGDQTVQASAEEGDIRPGKVLQEGIQMFCGPTVFSILPHR